MDYELEIINTNKIRCFVVLIFLIFIGLLLFSNEAHATEYITSGDWTYYVNSDETITVTKYNGEAETVTVPARIDGYNVKRLYRTFFDNTVVKGITVSDGIIFLDDTFYGCKNLGNIILPESIEKIYSGTFGVCSSLKELKLGKNVNYFDGNNFYFTNLETFSIDEDNPYYCSDGVLLFDKEKKKVISAPIRDLQSYTIPDSVAEIGSYGLAYTKLGADTLTDSIVSIEDYGLYEAGPYRFSLVLPSGLKDIGDNAFVLAGFKSIKFGKNVEEIGEAVFWQCHQLNDIIVDEENLYFSTDGIAVLSKDKSVLYDVRRYNIESYSIPDGVKTIKKEAFIDGEFKSIIIPDSVEIIEGFAFSYMDNLTSISFPDSVTSLDYNVLADCNNLVEVILPNSISKIPSAFLRNCKSLKSIQIPSGVTTIDDYAFSGCTSLEGIQIPSGVTTIDQYVFGGCTSLTEVMLPDTLININANAFKNCTSLESITIPETVDNISDTAFSGCTESLVLNVEEGSYAEEYAKKQGIQTVTYAFEANAEADFIYNELEDGSIEITGYTGEDTTITIPKQIDGKLVTSIGASAYFNNTMIKSIRIMDGVSKIDKNAFNTCTSLVRVKLPDSIEEIGDKGFYGCSNISSFNIPNNLKKIGVESFREVPFHKGLRLPDGMESIGEKAFEYCDIPNVYIPASVSEIGAGAFMFSSCERVNVAANNLNYSSELKTYSIGDDKYSLTSALYNKGKDVLIYYPNNGVSDKIVIRDGVKRIDDYALNSPHLKNIQEIELPESVESIGVDAFQNCIGLKYVTVPKSVTSMSDTVFKDVPNVTMKVYKDSYAASYAEQNNIPCIYLDVEECEHAWDEGTVTTKPTTSTTGVMTYTCTKCGETKTEDIPMLQEEEDISDYTFLELSDGTYQVRTYTGTDTEVVVPKTYKGKTVTSIGSNAFKENTKITSITLQEGMTTLSMNAFWGCSKLSSVTLPDGLLDIGDTAFYLCQALTEITIPDTVNSIGSSAFYGCYNIRTIHIPASVKYIGDWALYCGMEFESVTVDEDSPYFVSIDGILYSKDMTTLYACPSKAVRTGYDIPYGVTTIKDMAFKYCRALQTVTVPRTVNKIGNGAFDNCDGLKTLRIPKEVTSIGSSVFEGCKNVTLEVYKDSTAENYAVKNDIPYVCVDEYTSGNFTYEIKDDDTIVITRYTGSEEKIVVPETIDGVEVTEIRDRVFAGNSDVKKITVGENVTAIGDEAFADCDNLTNVLYKGDAVSFGESVYNGSENVEVIANEGSDAWQYANESDVSVHECTHVWDEGVVTTKATKDSDGVMTYTCTECGETKTEIIPKLEHTVHTWDEGVVTTEATATSEGVMTYTCTECGETKTEAIPKLQHTVHTWDEGVVTTKATTTSEGVKTYTCTECGVTKTEAIPKLEHTIHTWDEGVVTAEATVTSEGIMTYTCTECGETKTESIPKLLEKDEAPIEYVVVEKKVEKEVEKQVYVTVAEQFVKRGSQMKINGIIYTITSIDKCTVECTGLENDDMTEVDLKNVQLNINNDAYKISSIADNAFLNRINISKIDMGNIETIGENAFKGCSAGLKIDISSNNKLKSVGKGAFGSVASSNIIYPKSKKLKTQYEKLLSGSKKELTVIYGNGIYQVLNEKKKTAVYIGGTDSAVQNITVPATVKLSGNKYMITVVGKGALKNYKKLKKLRLGKNIEKVNKDAITGCVRLDNLTIDSKKLKTFSKSTIHKVNGKGLNVNPPSGKNDKYYKMLSKSLKVTK